ncbi:MAG: PH domain-containing protein [Erysipelotrichaceae bacterium]
MAEMKRELNNVTEWTFSDERDIPQDVYGYLAEGEVPHGAYYTLRDYAVFTNKRLIVVDSQGITGKKKEMYSLPYSAIKLFSVETAGMLDYNTEVQLFTQVGDIKIKLGRKVDILGLNKLLSNGILNSK